MKKYLTIVASALLMFAGANLYAQTAQDNLDKAKASLNDAGTARTVSRDACEYSY